MNILWTQESAAQATGGKAGGKWQASRVVIDSRAVRPGDLFVAIRGERFDGHAFVADALEKGAVAAVVSNAAGLPEEKLLIVKDAFKALEDLGTFARARTKAKIVGVTGSVGKTSAKEMLRIALSAHGKTYATQGNLNNHIGTPLNLANLPPDTDFAVLEMGMNHAGEIAHLTKMVRPHVAAITNVEAVHMEFFGSLEGIAQAKAEIFEGVGAGGIAVLNRDNDMYPLLAKSAKERGLSVVTFGENAKAQCRLLDYGAGAYGCAIDAEIYGRPLNYTLKSVGRHWALTSLLTLAVAHVLALDDEKTAHALAAFAEPEGRGRVVPLANEALLIDDSYNASPASMRAAFAKTAEIKRQGTGRSIAALGDMLELGAQAPSLHKALADDLTKSDFDLVFTAGPLMRHLHEALPATLRGAHVEKAAELLALLVAELKPGDIVLVKGSHGSKMYELARALQDGDKKHAV